MTTTTAVTPAKLLATPELLRDWLSAHEPTDLVGVPESQYSHPLAHFLRAHGIEDAAVRPRTIRWDWGEAQIGELAISDIATFRAAGLAGAVCRTGLCTAHRRPEITAAHAVCLLRQATEGTH